MIAVTSLNQRVAGLTGFRILRSLLIKDLKCALPGSCHGAEKPQSIDYCQPGCGTRRVVSH
jgi:hypothetical protein